MKPDKLEQRRLQQADYIERRMQARERGTLNAPVLGDNHYVATTTPVVFPSARPAARPRVRRQYYDDGQITPLPQTTPSYPSTLILVNILALVVLLAILLLLVAMAITGHLIVVQVY